MLMCAFSCNVPIYAASIEGAAQQPTHFGSNRFLISYWLKAKIYPALYQKINDTKVEFFQWYKWYENLFSISRIENFHFVRIKFNWDVLFFNYLYFQILQMQILFKPLRMHMFDKRSSHKHLHNTMIGLQYMSYCSL